MKDAIKRRKITLWLDKKSERHIQIMAALFFIGFLLSIAYGYKTLASWSKISQIYFAFAVVLSFTPGKALPFIYRIRKELKVILAVAALAPFLTGAALMLNFYISIDITTKAYKITQYNYLHTDQVMYVVLDSEIMNKHIEIRKFPMKNARIIPDSAVYDIHTGFLGIKTVHNPKLISRK